MLSPALGAGNVESTLVQFQLRLREVKSPAQGGTAKNEPGSAQTANHGSAAPSKRIES